MNHIQTTKPETPGDSYRVEFYPSADDYAYISRRISDTVPRPTLVQYSYQAFLLLNVVGFPAFLWLSEYFMSAVLVLGINAALLSWIIPWMNKEWLGQYYSHVFGEREQQIAVVELTDEGVSYSADDGDLFVPWRRVHAIEESDDSVFFFLSGNGIAVRKSGFAYRDEQTRFVEFAWKSLRATGRPELIQ